MKITHGKMDLGMCSHDRLTNTKEKTEAGELKMKCNTCGKEILLVEKKKGA